MSKKNFIFHDREVSWLSFNARVLQEAEDPNVPLIERLRFLGIFSNNLDEFFRVRVPTVQKMIGYGKKAIPVIGFDPKVTLKEINKINNDLQERFEATYEKLKKELEKESIFFLTEKDLDEDQKRFVRMYFDEIVQPALVPMMLSEDRSLPELNGKAIYLAIKLYNLDKEGEEEDKRYALIEVPSAVVSRFLVFPDTVGVRNIILLDDVIRLCLPETFAIFNFRHMEAYTVKLTRDAELDLEDDISSGIMEKLAVSLKNRKKGDPVRFVHDSEMPADLLDFIIKKSNLQEDDYVVSAGRYHNFKDYINFPKIGSKHMRYPKWDPLDHYEMEHTVSCFDVIKKHDVLLSYPYQSYRYIIDLLREAAIDPQVSSIKITVYRLVAKNSKIIHTLINAARNGKTVIVVVELKARFDEESNMNYANILQEEGVRVIFGAPGLKVHTKLICIKRKEDKKTVIYAHVGSGNFHEETAALYCDHSLLTANPLITNEVNKVFRFFKDNYKRYRYKHLIVSPFNSRRQFYKLIDNEIRNAKDGKEAYMIIKVNSLHDLGMSTKLYDASNAGVKVKLIARSINDVIPNLKGMSENIEAISIVDRFLEHARVLVFCNGGEEKIYMGSGDWMTRNIDARVEVMTPIYDENVRKQLRQILDLQLADNVKARLWDQELSNEYKKTDQAKKVRSQLETYRYFKAMYEKAEKKSIKKSQKKED